MSKNEWERGEFKLPASEFKVVRLLLVAEANRQVLENYSTSVEIQEKLVAAGKGRRNFDFHSLYTQLMANRPRNSNEHSIFSAIFPEKTETIGGRGTSVRSKKPKKPKKSSFPKVKKNEVTFFADGEASIRCNPKEKTIIWNVRENNHACDSARETHMANVFFRALDRVKWTNRTGGSVVGNDEYNQDSRHEGGGSNYTKDRYGRDEIKFTKRLR